MQSGSGKKIKWAGLLLLLPLLPLVIFLRKVGALYGLSESPFQRDTSVFFQSAVAWGLGENPYEKFGYVYPPLTLPLWKVFSHGLLYGEFYNSFLVLKAVGALFLVWLWRRHFSLQGPFFYLFVLLAFLRTLDADLSSGNITVFEVCLLSVAFVAFQRERLLAFTCLVVVSSVFKLTPILFLGLLLFSSHPRRLRYFWAGGLAFLVYLGGNFLFFPSETAGFFHLAWARTDEGGQMAPSTLAVLRSTYQFFLSRSLPLAQLVGWQSVYCFFSAWIGGLSFYALRRHNKNSVAADRWLVLFFFTFTYLLLLPRVKDYSYVIAIPGAYYILQRLLARSPQYFWPFFLLALLNPAAAHWPYLDFFYELATHYFAWMFLFLLWACSFPLLLGGKRRVKVDP